VSATRAVPAVSATRAVPAVPAAGTLSALRVMSVAAWTMSAR
jgi:hypothetical protein